MKKIILLPAAALALALISGPLSAGEIILVPEIGTTSADIDGAFTLEGEGDTSDDFLFGVMAGYKFENNITVALGYTGVAGLGAVTYGALDGYNMSEGSVLVGYTFEVARYLRVVPMVGWNQWRLTAKEGAFLNPGEEEELSEDGTNVVPRINFEIPFNDLFQLNIAYQRGDYDFGTMSSWRVGAKFEF